MAVRYVSDFTKENEKFRGSKIEGDRSFFEFS